MCISVTVEATEDVAWRLCGTSVARGNTNKLGTSPKYLQRRQQTPLDLIFRQALHTPGCHLSTSSLAAAVLLFASLPSVTTSVFILKTVHGLLCDPDGRIQM